MPPRARPISPLRLALIVLAACRGASSGEAPSARAEAAPSPPPAATLPAAPLASAATPRCADGRVLVPAGSFRMGSPPDDKDADADEHPVREITLRAYCIDRTEVTVASYARCVEAAACAPASATVVSRGLSPADVRFWSRFCNAGVAGREAHPVNCLDWKQAGAFCRWAGGRLPTEAEWEHAARGSDERRYPWGNAPPSASKLDACGAECGAKAAALGARAKTTMYGGDDGAETTAPVGSYPEGQSPFGVLDMAGNVWEWTADGYAPYDPASTDNPIHEQGPLRVVRGGHWLSALPQTVRAANRDSRHEDKRLEDVGIRCVSTPLP